MASSSTLVSIDVDEDDEDDDDDNGDSCLSAGYLSPVCSKSCSSDNARWQHLNLEHISRHVFPSAQFLQAHDRYLCSKCGSAYSSHWKSCRRSQGSGNCRCGGTMVDLNNSFW